MGQKILVLDLDGTLTNSKKEITPKTKQALQKILEEGHIVVLASGRPTPGVRPLAKELHLDDYAGYMLSYNGGKITECKTGKVVYQKTLPLDIVPELFHMAEEVNIGMVTYESGCIISNRENDQYLELEARINQLPIRKVSNIQEYVDFPVVKCLGSVEPERGAEVEELFRKRFGDRINVGRSEYYFLELTPFGIDKAASLQKLCEITGHAKEDMIACGDGLNDISMIKYAGLGVAMENAMDEVKAVADYITGSNDEDGIVQVIEQFILK